MANPIIETVAQAAARLGVTTRTINRRIQKGTMAGIKLPSPGRNGFINLLFTPSKSDVYAAAQDLAQRLERQIAINDALRLDLSRSHENCIGCEIIWPARMADLEEKLERLTASQKQP